MPPSTSREELRRRVYAAIDRRAEEIVGIGERIASHAEMGFKEIKTAQLVSETLQGLGLAPRTGLAMTGVRAEASWTGFASPDTPRPTARPAPRTPAATMPRSRACWARPWD